jgi:MFS family permease
LPIPRLVMRIRYSPGLVRWFNALRILLHRAPLHSQTDRNIWYLYVEVFWAAVLSAAAAFNAAFAVRLGASSTMIGWLSSIPSFFAVFLLIPSARFLESKSRRAPWIWGGLFVARLGYGLVAILPWLLTAHQAQGLVWLLIAISVPSTFFSAGFSPLLADLVPERDRAMVFANRNIILSAAVALLTLGAGWWLEKASQLTDWAAFPVNYQVLYLAGFGGSMLSMVYLFKIRVPESKVVRRERRVGTAKPSVAHLKAMFSENLGFVRIIGNTLVFDLGAWLVGPLYVLFFVRELGASDGWIGLNNTLANVGVILGYAFWRRWVRKLGYSRTLLITVPLASSYAFLVGLFPNLSAILAWGVLINLVNPGVNLSHFNILLKLCPDERRASYIATYSTMMNAGAFVGPMVGVALSELLGIRSVLLIGGAIRLLGALLFHVFPIRMPAGDIR